MIPHVCRFRKPSLRLVIVCEVQFLVISSVAGYLHLNLILWLWRPFVTRLSCLLSCKVYFEKSWKSCNASYGGGSGEFLLLRGVFPLCVGKDAMDECRAWLDITATAAHLFRL